MLIRNVSINFTRFYLEEEEYDPVLLFCSWTILKFPLLNLRRFNFWRNMTKIQNEPHCYLFLMSIIPLWMACYDILLSSYPSCLFIILDIVWLSTLFLSSYSRSQKCTISNNSVLNFVSSCKVFPFHAVYNFWFLWTIWTIKLKEFCDFCEFD